MTTARNYLADHGLAIRNARGKFSKEAKEFLAKAITDGQTFEDWNVNGRIKPVIEPRQPKPVVIKPEATVTPKPSAPVRKTTGAAAPQIIAPRREENIIRTVDAHGISATVDRCNNSHSIRRCNCREILPPAALKAVTWELAKQ